MKKTFSIILLAAIFIGLTACAKVTVNVVDADAKIFTKEEMSITLTKGFKETEAAGYTTAYDSDSIAVLVLKEAFTDHIGTRELSLEQYAAHILQSNADKNPSEIQIETGIPLIEYTYFNTETNSSYAYYTTMFKSNEGFWLIQFACEENEYETLRPFFANWAKTVRFS